MTMHEQPIAEVTSVDQEVFFDRFVLKNQPVVVRGAVSDWPAMGRWNDRYLRDKAGEEMVATAHLSPTSPLRFMPGNGQYREMSLAEFLTKHRHDERAYLTDASVPEPLHGDLGAHPVLRAFDRLADVENRVVMYLSHGARTTPLHYDDEENAYCVIQGRKYVQLFDPIHLHCLYPYDDDRRVDHSQLDLARIDEQRFPRASEAIKQVATLYPGDLLYLPCGWWHQIESGGHSLSVSFVRLDRDRLYDMFLRLVEHGCIRDGMSEWRSIVHLKESASTSSVRREQWFEDPLLVALVRYRDLQQRAVLDDRHDCLEIREILSGRIRHSYIPRSIKYLLQNVFEVPLGGYFNR